MPRTNNGQARTQLLLHRCIPMGLTLLAILFNTSQAQARPVLFPSPVNPVRQQPRTVEIPSIPASVPQNTQPSTTPVPIIPPAPNLEPGNSRLNLSDLLVIEPNLMPGQIPQMRPATPVSATPPSSPSLPQNSNYRVIVQTRSASQEEQVRSLVPGSFRTVYNGQRMMQVGLFSSRENAEQIIRTLDSNGLQGILIRL